MNHEQLAFFNQQLGGMLASGLPLESSLKQLSAAMARGALRDEIERLEADLEQGVPLDEALGRRRLPELYTAMLRAGVRGNNLPGVLTLAADYYGQLHNTWLRLKGLLVYPAIVLAASLAISTLLAVIYTRMMSEAATEAFGFLGGPSQPGLPLLFMQVWLPVVLLAAVAGAFLIVAAVPRLRHAALWKLPGFREANLARLASTMAVMLEQGTNLDTALEVAQRSESCAKAREELARWRQRLAGGAARFADIAPPGRLAPPLFVWLVAGAGENLALGFRRAAEAYDARARFRIDLALYAALPVSMLLLAAIIGLEMAPIIKSFISTMNSLSDMGGME